MLARAAGRPVDEWRGDGEVAVARTTTTIAAGPIEAGTVAAQRTTIVGRSEGVDVVRFRPTWYCTADVDPAWDLGPTGWRVQVHGDAPLDVRIDFPVALDDLGAFTPAYTANRPVNSVPYVCAAPPGILRPLIFRRSPRRARNPDPPTPNPGTRNPEHCERERVFANPRP